MDALNFIGGTLPLWLGLAVAYLAAKGADNDNR